MATLLMIESWMHSTGQALPPLLAELGHEYVLVTRDPGLYPGGADGLAHPVVRYADEVVVADTNDLDRLVESASAVARRRRVDGVLTTCDYYLEAVAVVARQLGLPGEDPEVMAVATRKDRVRAALAVAGVPDVGHAVAGTWEEARKAAAQLGYPVVVKPVDANAGTGVLRVTGEAELEAAYGDVAERLLNSRGQARPGVLLLEAELTGREVSVETVTWRGRTSVLAVTDKAVTGAPAFVESSHMVPARLSESDRAAVTGLAVAVLEALGLRHGLAHTEIMITPDGPRVVEVNPRQGGGSIFELVEIVTGTNPLAVLVDLALGRRPAISRSAPASLPGTVETSGAVGTAGRRATARDGGGARSAALVFVVSPRRAGIESVVGVERLAADPHVLRWTLPVPVVAPHPVDNSAYLGHVLVVDPTPHGARARAEQAVASLRLRTTDGDLLQPLGIPTGLA